MCVIASNVYMHSSKNGERLVNEFTMRTALLKNCYYLNSKMYYIQSRNIKEQPFMKVQQSPLS